MKVWMVSFVVLGAFFIAGYLTAATETPQAQVQRVHWEGSQIAFEVQVNGSTVRCQAAAVFTPDRSQPPVPTVTCR